MEDNTGLLLINLGTPDNPHRPAVKKYLKEFLMDPLVINSPYLIRYLLVHLIIVPFRSKKSSRAYKTIWKEKSPLLKYSEDFTQKIKSAILLKNNKKNYKKILLAMRYGNPSLKYVLESMARENIFKLDIFTFYPHYAMSTIESVETKLSQLANKGFAKKKFNRQFNFNFLPVYYSEKNYLQVLANSIFKKYKSGYHLLFSYHGLPLDHLQKVKEGNKHCLSEDCCEKEHPCQKYCYRHQVLQTTEKVMDILQDTIPRSDTSIAFQSRLRGKWLTPYTDEWILDLLRKGVKKIQVVCPAFTVDCLETLEEVEIALAETFLQAGGEDLKLIPCLNTNEDWIEFAANFILEKKNNLEHL